MTKFHDMNDLQLVTLCIYGEARGEGLDGMCAVAHVILNRARKPSWWGFDIGTVVLKENQFSCFSNKDVNREILEGLAAEYDSCIKTNPTLRAAQYIAKGVMAGELYSPVGPATHYHSIRARPTWIAKMKKLITIGEHVFYIE